MFSVFHRHFSISQPVCVTCPTGTGAARSYCNSLRILAWRRHGIACHGHGYAYYVCGRDICHQNATEMRIFAEARWFNIDTFLFAEEHCTTSEQGHDPLKPAPCPATSVQDLYCFSRAPIATSQERCSAAEPMGVRRCGCMCKCSPDPCSIRRSGHSHLCTVLNSSPALRSSGYHNRSRRSRRPGPVQPDACMLGRNCVRLALGNESRTRFSQCIFLHHCQSATRIC